MVQAGWRRTRCLVLVGVLVHGGLLAPTADAAWSAPRRTARPVAPTVDVAPLRAALVGADLDAAGRAATALGELADPAAHEVLVDALATGLHPRVAAVALAAVAARPAPGDPLVLRLYAVHRNPEARAAALIGLGAHGGDAEGRALMLTALGDQEPSVRTAAARGAAAARLTAAAPRLLALLARGDAGAGPALAALADADLARRIAELLGRAPDPLLAQCLGALLRRPDFGPDPARVQVVRALAKVPGPEAITALTDYVEAVPATPARASRREAEQALEVRGGRP
jgi:HEAT repeat protein